MSNVKITNAVPRSANGMRENPASEIGNKRNAVAEYEGARRYPPPLSSLHDHIHEVEEEPPDEEERGGGGGGGGRGGCVRRRGALVSPELATVEARRAHNEGAQGAVRNVGGKAVGGGRRHGRRDESRDRLWGKDQPQNDRGSFYISPHRVIRDPLFDFEIVWLEM